MNFRTSRCGSVVAGALAAIAMTAGTVHAQSPAERCSTAATSKPFMPWLDVADYVLAPGGDIEAGSARWTLRGGAAIVDGNEPFHVGASNDRAALSLPAGSSAATAPMCLGIEYPTLRFFAKQHRLALSGSLLVDAVLTDAEGHARVVAVGAVENGGFWMPTTPLPIAVSTLGAIGPVHVSFRFTPVGSDRWSIDDVYVDPYRTI